MLLQYGKKISSSSFGEQIIIMLIKWYLFNIFLPLNFSRLRNMIATTVKIQPFRMGLEVRCRCCCEVTLLLRWNCLVHIGVPKNNIPCATPKSSNIWKQ